MLNQFTTQMVLAWWVKVELDSPARVGTIILAFGVPFFLFLFPAGLIADRWDRKKQLQVAQGVAIALATGLGLLITFEMASFTIAIIFALLLGSTGAMSNPAQQALIPMLVPRRLLMNGIVLGSLSMNMSRLIAPMIAGFLMALIGVNAALFFIAVFLLVGFTALTMMRIPHFPEDDPAPGTPPAPGSAAPARPPRPGIWDTLGGGVRFLWNTKPLLVLMLLYMATGLFVTGPIQTLVPVLIDDVWNSGPEALGYAFSAQAAAGLVMGFYLTRFGGLRNKGGFFALSMMGGSSSLALYSISPVFGIGLLFFMTFGVAAALYASMSQTVLQSHTPREVMGRVLSLNQLSIMGMNPVGAQLAGFLAEYIGPQQTGLIGGSIGFAMATSALLFARRFRNLS